ncbi:MFS transporter [Mesorhizobium sp. M4B.F.Ca.ET.215.01.1.1]|uniref:multidrug efflux MFS transporter n=1 Tax=unclassified Mesorhizobium TaxID=325217 RepID=UPI000FCC313B|nr:MULTISPECIES: multidrug efflux MFS transporter [unclassified Mesorhizobium]RUW23164.1 MFS transporter [Mesorhizobium sp. M4B.F.Ca.ET.013.02.1.1]RVD38282.1 MFS transporter [Mesorhizobium sp. M4B.F.Ca.ET.019.03.1.1]TGQ07355.1 MFS transporter [Mesorhizobium sp. M4B.F.Ca.ET.215.01.1.1]TGQ35449.1 MFS transporter [Mesorhizobium sp. M00.F.Ca.ET.220.01.1.1]TGR00621.1 MFS transporter [Mesorhizobium sp. M4B.F.Ca.ET.203.01.1.1]
MSENGSEHGGYNVHWRRNLAVCFAGSFSTLIAMTLLLPFLPLYVEQLGAKGHAAIVQWSGIAYGATFLAAALVAPLWGRLGDRYGRKLMLVRASFGMAICMSLTGMVETVWQLVLLRLLIGFAGGYSSGSTILVAMQTPKERSGWALGVLSAGITAGSLVGPLLGGAVPPLIGIRATFLLSGGVIFLAFLATTFLIKETPRPPAAKTKAASKPKSGWSQIPDKRPVAAMLATGMLLAFATMSIEPIITVYVQQLIEDQSRVTLVAGVVMSAAALGAILSASWLGRLADRIGHWNVVIAALGVSALLLIPQAFVTEGWQLIGLRFLMGLALGGLLPCITSVIRHNVPDGVGGNVLGLSISAQYVGQVAGPLLGGFAGGHFGMRSVFLGTSVLMAGGAVYNWIVQSRRARHMVLEPGKP